MPIEFVQTQERLSEICNQLSQKTEISFDTEFDRFHREYGFKLSLLQIFDGEICFIIDPISITDLSGLWPIFESQVITKVVYSCSEDMQILKVNGCQPHNIYDVQIAAKLCNSPSNSYAELLKKELDIELDKSMQRSDWRKRPLSEEQTLYASNDVTALLKLKEIFVQRAAENNVTAFVEEDCLACENIAVTEFRVKLSANQKKNFDTTIQKKIYALLLLRNEIAKEYNIPPASVFTDSIAEQLVMSKNPLSQFPPKSFCSRLKRDDESLLKIEELINIPAGDFPEIPFIKSTQKFIRSKDIDLRMKPDEDKLELLRDHICNKFGPVAADHILRGFKKSLSSVSGMDTLKTYQQNVIKEAVDQLNLEF